MKTPIKIDKGVPIPPRARNSELPWDNLKVGDSFLCPKEMPRGAAASAAQYQRTKRGWHFIVRTTPEGVRVWRDK